MEEPQNPQEEKQKSYFWRFIDWVIKIKENILKVGAVLGILSILTLWVTKDKEPELVGYVGDFVMEHKECLHDDVITGEMWVNGKIKKAALCSLTVYNKFKKDVKTIISNEIKQTNGTFQFSFCKATTDYVIFTVNDYRHDEYVSPPYPVDSIPKIVDFQ
jgi:hypothetical protein